MADYYYERDRVWGLLGLSGDPAGRSGPNPSETLRAAADRIEHLNRQVTELQRANNAEVERRRVAESQRCHHSGQIAKERDEALAELQWIEQHVTGPGEAPLRIRVRTVVGRLEDRIARVRRAAEQLRHSQRVYERSTNTADSHEYAYATAFRVAAEEVEAALKKDGANG